MTTPKAQVRNNIGHSFYNNYNPPNHYTNVQSHHPKYYSSNYYAIQRRPYSPAGAQRSVNMVDYHNSVGYISPVQTPYEQARQPPKVHSIIYANQIGNYGPTQRRGPVNFWAEWSTWSKCSKPCNGGVRTRIRVCKSNDQSQYGGYPQGANVRNNCVGYKRGYKACNTQVCMTKDQMKNKKVLERKALCAKQNKIVGGSNYKLIPYMRDGLNECKLNCLAEGHKMFKSFGSVKDGTMCGHKDGFVCMKGQCKKGKAKEKVFSKPTKSQSYPIGVNSNRRLNAPIGVSNSRRQNIPTNRIQPSQSVNKRWVYIKNNIVKTNGMSVGYNHMLRLPRGAVNITIRELVPSFNYFALKIGKLYILNGKWPIKSDKLFYAASSTFRYVVTKTANQMSLEKIFSPGPLADAVDVMVFYNNRSPVNITYQYSLQKTQQVLGIRPSSQQQPLSGGISHYPPQRLRYGQGRLNSAPNFRRFNAGSNNLPYNPTGNNNLPYNPSGNNVPYNIRPNNVPYNPPLNNGGVRGGFNPRQVNRPFNPVHEPKGYNPVHNNQGYNPRLLQPNSPLLQPKPYVLPQAQQTQKVMYRWQIGGITKCTAKCNGGEQEYIYRCFATTGKNGKFVADTSCHNLAQKPTKKRMCNMQACPVKWVTSQWSRCPKVCGQNSTQHRTAVCKEFQEGSKASTHNNVVVDNSKCADLPEPKLKQECHVIPCKYNWKVGQWTKCSKTCDFGTQRRYVYCQDANGRYFGENKCEHSTKPNNTKSCLEAHCTAEWFTSEWGACSSACGSGTQTRRVICRSSGGLLLSEKHCERNTKPSSKRPCTGKICNGGFWVASEWSKCSSHCGFGNQYRKVFCAAATGSAFTQVNEHRCPASSKPSEMKRCENKNCQPLWYTTNWEKCSVTCGRGIQRRLRLCMSDDGSAARGCYYQLRPTLLQFCSKPSCSSKLASKTISSRFASLIHRSQRVQVDTTNNQKTEKTTTKSTTTPSKTTTLPTTTTVVETTILKTKPPTTSTEKATTSTEESLVSSTATTTVVNPGQKQQQQQQRRQLQQKQLQKIEQKEAQKETLEKQQKKQTDSLQNSDRNQKYIKQSNNKKVPETTTKSPTTTTSTTTTTTAATTTTTKTIPTTQREETTKKSLVLNQGRVKSVNVSALNPRNIRIKTVQPTNPVIKRNPYKIPVKNSNIKQVKHVITVQNATQLHPERRKVTSQIEQSKGNEKTANTTNTRTPPPRIKRVHVKRINFSRQNKPVYKPTYRQINNKRKKTFFRKTPSRILSNRTQKVIKDCKADFYSTGYCKIIANHLKLCRLNKFVRGCCLSCKKAAKK